MVGSGLLEKNSWGLSSEFWGLDLEESHEAFDEGGWVIKMND